MLCVEYQQYVSNSGKKITKKKSKEFCSINVSNIYYQKGNIKIKNYNQKVFHINFFDIQFLLHNNISYVVSSITKLHSYTQFKIYAKNVELHIYFINLQVFLIHPIKDRIYLKISSDMKTACNSCKSYYHFLGKHHRNIHLYLTSNLINI